MNMMMEIGTVIGVVMEEGGVEGGVVVISVDVEEEDTMDLHLIYSKMEDTTKTYHLKAVVFSYFLFQYVSFSWSLISLFSRDVLIMVIVLRCLLKSGCPFLLYINTIECSLCELLNWNYLVSDVEVVFIFTFLYRLRPMKSSSQLDISTATLLFGLSWIGCIFQGVDAEGAGIAEGAVVSGLMEGRSKQLHEVLKG